MASRTGIGACHYKGPAINLAIQHYNDGPIPAMPANHFKYENDVQNIFTLLTEDLRDDGDNNFTDRKKGLRKAKNDFNRSTKVTNTVRYSQ